MLNPFVPGHTICFVVGDVVTRDTMGQKKEIPNFDLYLRGVQGGVFCADRYKTE